MIAPFWADIDLRYTNSVVYLGHVLRYSAEEVVSTQAADTFDAVTSLVLVGAGDSGFLPTEVVTVTWQDVSPYPSSNYRLQVCTIYAILSCPHNCNTAAIKLQSPDVRLFLRVAIY